MSEPTEAEKRRQARREERAAAETPQAIEAGMKTSAVPLSAMLGDGNIVCIGDLEYEVAAFPLAKLSQAGKLIALCPEMLVTAALSAKDGQADAESVTAVTNRLVTQAKAMSPDTNIPEMNAEMVGYALSTLALEVSDAQAQTMQDLTLLALSRQQPNILPEDINDDLDIQTFFAVLCTILDVNQALKKRF